MSLLKSTSVRDALVAKMGDGTSPTSAKEEEARRHAPTHVRRRKQIKKKRIGILGASIMIFSIALVQKMYFRDGDDFQGMAHIIQTAHVVNILFPASVIFLDMIDIYAQNAVEIGWLYAKILGLK